jgi:hypothetical protein
LTLLDCSKMYVQIWKGFPPTLSEGIDHDA